MPLRHAPKRRFDYLAFYQPASFGRLGKCIRYYARIAELRPYTRRELLPLERHHPRAGEKYYRVRILELQKLFRPIRNKRFPARRVSFGFTTLRRLLTAKNMLELYNVSQTEEMMAQALQRSKIPAMAQHYVRGNSGGKRAKYFLDFAIMCKRGNIAIECDNNKAHGTAFQRMRDKAKNDYLRNNGWTVIRLAEKKILDHLPECILRLRNVVARLGGAERASQSEYSLE